MAEQLLATGEVASAVGLPRWRLQYLLESGQLPPPSFVVAGRRLFTEEAVRRIEAVLATAPELGRRSKSTRQSTAAESCSCDEALRDTETAE